MGKIGLLIVFFNILSLDQALGRHIYSINQEKLKLASLEGNIDEPFSSIVHPSFCTIMNTSNLIQHSNESDAFEHHGGAILVLYAGHILDSQSYYGVVVTSDMYGFTIDKDEASGMVIQLNNLGDNSRSSFNGISVGWHVYPGLSGDSKTHFFVDWTRDGYQNTGCYNLKCPGFIPEANIPVVPGAIIDPLSQPCGVKRTIIFKVVKDSNGDWLLHVGFDSKPYLFGRFPKSLFNILDKANEIKPFGFVWTHKTKVAPMGSGFLSNNNKKAAALSNIHIIAQNGRTSLVTSRNKHDYMTDKAIYSVSTISSEGMFTYGGPMK